MKNRLWCRVSLGGLLGCLLVFASGIAQAQVRPGFKDISFKTQPLTEQQGTDILNAAQEWLSDPGVKPDCSHLTHDVYARAGYPYPYARSVDIYLGIRNFVRVKRPQPGDLIVWRGHVGIVVSPEDHSFYSSVRTGLRTEYYDIPAWRKRGPARFYRYVDPTPTDLALAENPQPEGLKSTHLPFYGPLPAVDEDFEQANRTSSKPTGMRRVRNQSASSNTEQASR